MSETAKTWGRSSNSHRATPDRPAHQQREPLDARRPWRLDSPGLVLRVAAGYVDLFVVRYLDGRADGPRTHLFRVESGDVILGLPSFAEAGRSAEIGILAVGAQASEVVVLDRDALQEPEPVDAWIARLSATIATARDGVRREPEVDATLELVAGQCLDAPARGVAWIRANQGELRLMDAAETWGIADGPLPIAAGTWIESVGGAVIAVEGGDGLTAEERWRAVDRFHALAMTLLAHRLAQASEFESLRLANRIHHAAAQSQRANRELAGLILPQHRVGGGERDAGDPLLAACQAVGQAMGVQIIKPARRLPDRTDFADVAEIARASRLRIRRTLLRANWWRRSVGALVAWRGEEQEPVAIIPVSPRHYVMVEPRSGARHPIDAASASTLSAEAATFYRPLPSRAISAADLLRIGAEQIGGDITRILVAATAMGIIALAPPIITEVLVDSVIPRSDFGQLVLCAAALIMAAVGTAGFQGMQGIAMLRLGGLLDWTLQASIVDRLLRLPAGFFKRYTAGDLADRALGIEAMRQVLTGRVMGGLLAGVFCLFSFALMLYYDVRLALVAMGILALQGATIVIVAAVRLRHERLHFDLQGKVQGLVLQLLTGVGKLRAAAATLRAFEMWSRGFSAQKRHFVASQSAANFLVVFEVAFPTLATLVIFGLAGGNQSARAMGTGEFLAFFTAFGQSLSAVISLGTAAGESLIAIPFLSRLKPIIADPVEISEQRQDPGELSGALELNDVTFRYLEGAAAVLNRVSLRVRPGDYVALVGPSGSGKSTVFRLLLGFEQPVSGTILFDGKPIDTLDVGAVRRQIGVVLQSGKLTSGSLYENICGAVRVPIEQAWEAARLAGLDADIEAMPMGMHTVITEGMSTLSGGQRQRLVIARALVHRPRILLFDEATSALDNRVQSIVSTSLAKLDVTRIVIAHRLSTIQDADRIIVLVGGAVMQTGTFAELSELPGPFAELAKRQLL